MVLHGQGAEQVFLQQEEQQRGTEAYGLPLEREQTQLRIRMMVLHGLV